MDSVEQHLIENWEKLYLYEITLLVFCSPFKVTDLRKMSMEIRSKLQSDHFRILDSELAGKSHPVDL